MVTYKQVGCRFCGLAYRSWAGGAASQPPGLQEAPGFGTDLATAQGVPLGIYLMEFTALMDKFNLTCKSEHDVDKLAHIFSHYISDMVGHVL